jgi:hypothetical protein
MQATPHLPSLPLMVTSLPGLPRFLANPQLPTRASLFPVGRDIFCSLAHPNMPIASLRWEGAEGWRGASCRSVHCLGAILGRFEVDFLRRVSNYPRGGMTMTKSMLQMALLTSVIAVAVLGFTTDVRAQCSGERCWRLLERPLHAYASGGNTLPCIRTDERLMTTRTGGRRCEA